MTKFALIVIVALVGTLVQAGDIPEGVQAQLDVLEDGYNQAVAALEAEAEEDPKKEIVLREFKKIYSAGIALIRNRAEEGEITAETLEASPYYQAVKAQIQKALHKGQLGLSDKEIIDAVKDGVLIAGGIVKCFSPLLLLG